MARELKVALVADARPFNNTLDQAIGRVTGFSSRLKAMGGGSIGKGLAIGAGVAGFNLLTEAVSVTIGKLDEMHQAFLDDEASQQRLANALKNNVTNFKDAAKATEDFAQAQGKLGFQDDDVRTGLEQLVSVTHDANEAMQLFSLAEDVARAKGIDIATAVDAVNKGYNGQARALSALGIDLKGASGGAEILARTLKSVRGEANAYATTSAGRIDKANAQMNQTFEKVGGAIDKVSQIVIPIMAAGLSGLVTFAGDVIGAFTNLVNYIQNTFGPALSVLGDIIRNVLSPLALLADIGANVVGAIHGAAGGGGGSTGVVDVTKPGSHNIGIPVGDTGGVVGGPPGSHSLVVAAAGELLTMPGQGNNRSGPNIIVNIESFIGSDRDIDRFADRLAFRLRSTTLS